MEVNELENLKRIKKNCEGMVFTIPGVWCIGIGDNTIRVCIHPESKHKHLIPKSVEGIPIEIIEGPVSTIQ